MECLGVPHYHRVQHLLDTSTRIARKDWRDGDDQGRMDDLEFACRRRGRLRHRRVHNVARTFCNLTID